MHWAWMLVQLNAPRLLQLPRKAGPRAVCADIQTTYCVQPHTSQGMSALNDAFDSRDVLEFCIMNGLESHCSLPCSHLVFSFLLCKLPSTVLHQKISFSLLSALPSCWSYLILPFPPFTSNLKVSWERIEIFAFDLLCLTRHIFFSKYLFEILSIFGGTFAEIPTFLDIPVVQHPLQNSIVTLLRKLYDTPSNLFFLKEADSLVAHL